MKRSIIVNFAFAAVIIVVITAMMYQFHGVLGVAAYILFAGICLTPAIIKARSILKREKGSQL